MLGLLLILFGCALFPSRTIGALVSGALGFAALLYGLFVPGLGTTSVLLWMGVGVLLVFFGVARVTTRLIPRLSALMSPDGALGRLPAGGDLLALLHAAVLVAALRRVGARVCRLCASSRSLGGALINPLLLVIVLVMWIRKAVSSWEPEWPMEFPASSRTASTTRIGTENARRNPQRTASTAAALMIGLALVTLVATLAAGIIASFEGSVNDLFAGDYAITAQNNFSPIPIDAADAAAKAPGVTAIGNVRTGETLVFGETVFSTAVDPGMAQVIELDWKDGSQDGLLEPRRRTAFSSTTRTPKTTTSTVGSPMDVTFPNGTTKTFVVEGHLRPADRWLAVRQRHDLRGGLGREKPQPDEHLLLLEDGGRRDRSEPGGARRSARGLPECEGADAQEFIDNQISGLSSVLNILYVLLALSVIVSLFGIVNTLVLTVFERTREIGMLRAIGMTRRQVRRMIRHESVITALIGAVLGIVLGIVLAALLIARVDFLVFSFPTTQVIVFVIAAIVVGIVAAIFPARRAAKLDPLRAIAYE